MARVALIGTADRHLSARLGDLVAAAGLRVIRTNNVDRILKELKQPGRLAIIDMTWEDAQEHGVLRQMVNLGRICENPVVVMCPNTDEDLKKLARRARPAEVFIRYDLAGRFKEYLTGV